MPKSSQVAFWLPRLFLAGLLLAGIASMPEAAETPTVSPRVDAGIAWYDVSQWGVEGKGWANTARYYDRLPAKAEGVVRAPSVEPEPTLPPAWRFCLKQTLPKSWHNTGSAQEAWPCPTCPPPGSAASISTDGTRKESGAGSASPVPAPKT